MRWYVAAIAMVGLSDTFSIAMSTAMAQSPDPFQTVVPQRPASARPTALGGKPPTTTNVPSKPAPQGPDQKAPTQPETTVPELFGLRPGMDFTSAVAGSDWSSSTIAFLFTPYRLYAWMCKPMELEAGDGSNGELCLNKFKDTSTDHGKVNLVGYYFSLMTEIAAEKDALLATCEARYQRLLTYARSGRPTEENAVNKTFYDNKFFINYVTGADFANGEYKIELRKEADVNRDLGFFETIGASENQKHGTGCTITYVIMKKAPG